MAFLAPIATAIGAIAPIISLVGTVVGIGSEVAGIAQSTQASMQLADYRTEVANRNAAIMQQNAVQTIQASEVDQQQLDLKNRAVIGDQIAAQAASGIKLSSGTFVRSRASTRIIASIDRMNVRQAGVLQANNYRQQAQDFTDEAKFLHDTRGNAAIQGMFQAIGTIAQGFTGLDYSKFIPNVPQSLPASQRWDWSSI